MKNKKFEHPELVIIIFDEKEDIITTSGDNYDPYDPDKDYWQD